MAAMQLKITPRGLLILVFVLGVCCEVTAVGEIAKKFLSMLVGVYTATTATFKGIPLPSGLSVHYREVVSKINIEAIHVRTEIYLFRTALAKVYLLEIEDEDDSNVRVYHLTINQSWLIDQKSPYSIEAMSKLTNDDIVRKYCNIFNYDASITGFKLTTQKCTGYEPHGLFNNTDSSLTCGNFRFYEATDKVNVALRKFSSYAKLLPARWTPKDKPC